MQTPLTATQRAASVIRAELARRRIPQSAVAELLNISQASVSRRLSGEIPWDVNEIDAVAKLIGVPAGIFVNQDGAA